MIALGFPIADLLLHFLGAEGELIKCHLVGQFLFGVAVIYILDDGVKIEDVCRILIDLIEQIIGL